jgi:hypothetical protein
LELEPEFTVQVFLDGDDDAQAQFGNALTALERAVAAMKADGLIREGSVRPATATATPSPPAA